MSDADDARLDALAAAALRVIHEDDASFDATVEAELGTEAYLALKARLADPEQTARLDRELGIADPLDDDK